MGEPKEVERWRLRKPLPSARLGYAFESAYRLLEDFFAEVDRVIKEAQQ